MKTYTVSVDGIEMKVVRDSDGKFIVPEGWRGIGSALKPAWEPVCLARKPIGGTIASNVLQHGTGALNIDGCRIAGAPGDGHWTHKREIGGNGIYGGGGREEIDNGNVNPNASGRWPANLCHDGSEEVLAAFPQTGDGRKKLQQPNGHKPFRSTHGEFGDHVPFHLGDSGSAARFFYSSKADKDDRCDSKHPTVKPVALMRWLVRLITPPGGLVLDPFAGSGTTGVACIREGFDCILIEREAQYVTDIRHRLAKLSGLDMPLLAGAAP